jgi:adenylyl-sulfate kinase
MNTVELANEREMAQIWMPTKLETLPASNNIFFNHSKVAASQREIRNGHGGRVIWLTGLSGAGKSTIATELERQLFKVGQQTYILDGDNIRHGLGRDLTFSMMDRSENIRRVAEVAKLFADAGMICITAFISPSREQRAMARKIIPSERFVEVYVNAPLEVCEERDTKGLYAKARANKIPDFTGVSSPYEAPENPAIEIRTDLLSVAESVAKIRDHLNQKDSQLDCVPVI